MHIFLLWITHFFLFLTAVNIFYFLQFAQNIQLSMYMSYCTPIFFHKLFHGNLPPSIHLSGICLPVHIYYNYLFFLFRWNRRKELSNFFLLGKAIEMSILYWNKRSYPFKTAPYYIPIILSVLIPFCIICCILCNHHALIQCIPFCIKPPHKGFFFQYRILWNWNHITGQNLITFVTVRIR